MKSYTITVPDNKEDIFIEMMKSINFVEKIQVVSETIIPEKHKETVRTRIQQMEEHPESCLNWEDIERKIKL